MPDITRKTLGGVRRSLVWWSLGMAGIAAVWIPVYPTVRDSPSLNDLLQQYPEALKSFIGFGGSLDYTTGAGYLGSEVFSLTIPLVLIIAAVAAGARAIAGEEEQGTLDLLLANPVSRRRVVWEKLAALVVEMTVLGLVLWIALWVGARAVDMKVSGLHILAGSIDAVVLALMFGCIALLVGSASGHRGRAVAITAALAVAAYLLDAIAPLANSIDFLQKASPFYHYKAADPLREGLDLHVALLAAVAAVAAVLAPLAFDRRDLTS